MDVTTTGAYSERLGLITNFSFNFCRGGIGQTMKYLWPVFVHGQVTIIFVVSVLFVCLSVCLFVCAEFFLAVFDPISIKLGHILYVWV